MSEGGAPTPDPHAGPRPVSRAGAKLAHALEVFGVDPAGLGCADLGCSTGGFTQQLLLRGAAFVVAVDTAYGVLDYSLRRDPRVIVMERTNALHAERPNDLPGAVELVTIDLGWTVQKHCIPAALRWFGGAGGARGGLAGREERSGRIITLIKPHYEAKGLGMEAALVDGVVGDVDALVIAERVIEQLTSALPIESLGLTASPIRGSKSDRKSQTSGNLEYLALLRPREGGA